MQRSGCLGLQGQPGVFLALIGQYLYPECLITLQTLVSFVQERNLFACQIV